MNEMERNMQHSHHHHHEDSSSSLQNESHSRGINSSVLTIRALSGLSGDMFLAGLLKMTEMDTEEAASLLSSILPELAGSIRLTRKKVNNVGGWHVEVSLPHQHEHRTLTDILQLISGSELGVRGKELAVKTFTLLAEAEARVHETRPEEIHFHEVGALDSILDICLSCELFVRLAPARFVVSPVPVADGEIICAHGIIPSPAPVVLELLAGIPVVPFKGRGETVTPTGIALLQSLGASFGPWPAMTIEKKALVYGSRVFSDAPNGTIFAYGTCSD